MIQYQIKNIYATMIESKKWLQNNVSRKNNKITESGK